MVILHEDDEMLIVDKPAGLLSQAGMSPELADCQESRARDYCSTVTLVHRLDRDTSGILIFAKTPAAHRHLGLQFERRHLKKRYTAVVWGQVAEESGLVDAPLRSDWPNRPMQKICVVTFCTRRPKRPRTVCIFMRSRCKYATRWAARF